jgi:hypothetical protein
MKKVLNAPLKWSIFMYNKGGVYMDIRYIERKAAPGEYVRHKLSGEIIAAEQIREDGAVLHSNVMSEYGDYVMDRFYWELHEYLVMEFSEQPEPLWPPEPTEPEFCIECEEDCTE